jgi:hypothetical protein
MRQQKLRSGINWQRALKKNGHKTRAGCIQACVLDLWSSIFILIYEQN